MPKIKFSNGVTVNVEGNPTQADIDEIAAKIVGQNNQGDPGGVTGAFKRGWQGLKEDINNRMNKTEEIMRRKQSPLSTKLQEAGQGFGFVGDVFGRGFGTALSAATPDIVEKPIKNAFTKGVEKIMKTKTAQDVIGGYQVVKKENPEAIGNIEAVINILDAFLNATMAGGAKNQGQKLIKNTIKEGENIVKSSSENIAKNITKVTESNLAQKIKGVGEKALEFAGKKDVSTESAINSFKANLLQQIEGKASSIKKLNQKISDVIDTIAKNPNYHPIIDAENKTFNVSDALRNMANDKNVFGEQLSNLFSKVDDSFGGFDTKKIIEKISEKVLSEKNNSKLLAIGGKDSSFIKNTRKLLSGMLELYGEKTPRNEIWKLRQTIDKAINSMSDNQVAKSLRQDVRKAFAESLETSIPNDQKQLVKRAMEELQKIIEAEDYTKNVLQGFKIQGGKMTDLIRNAVGTEIGKSVGIGGGAILGGIPGAAAGFVASKKLGEWLAKNTLLNASQRNAILKVVKETPEVFDDMKAYLESLNKEGGTKSLKEGLKKLGK